MTTVLPWLISTDGGSSFFFYSAVWLGHLSLLFLFPKNRSDAETIALIGLPALFCRLLLAVRFQVSAGSSTAAGQWSIFWAIFFDLATLGWIVALLQNRALPLRWSILYAFSPVLLYAHAEGGNMEAGFTFFLLGAIFFYDRRRWGWMYFFSGLSVAVNWYAAAAVPFLFRRENLRSIWVLVPAAGFSALFHHLFDLSDRMESISQVPIPTAQVGGSIPVLVTAVFGDSFISSFSLYVLLGTTLLYGWRYVHPVKNPHHANDPVSGCFFALGACLLFSNDFHFRNLSWIVPFLCFRPFASWILFSLSMGLITCSGFAFSASSAEAAGQAAPLWASLLGWGPFWLFFLNDLYLARLRNKAPIDNATPESVTVVIPAVNEALRIGGCIESARMHPAVQEVIVVDGGSTDGTVEKASEKGAVTLRLDPNRRGGRGGQIFAGIRSSSGDIVVVVHADVRINARIVQDILLLMKKQPMFAGGAVGSVFDSRSFRYRLIETANDFRMVCLGIGFGDQVQFFRRRPVVEADLFPDIPLMEDVEFSIRLHRLGRQAFLFGDARVSPRRWEQKGAAHAGTVIRLFASYLFQRLWKNPDTEGMYRKYYGECSRSTLSEADKRVRV